MVCLVSRAPVTSPRLSMIKRGSGALEAQAQQDRNGNVRPVKSRNYCILDPLVASIIAMHTWGGKQASCYEQT